MKNFMTLALLTYCCLSLSAQKKETIIIDFTEQQKRATLLELREDSLRFQLLKDTMLIGAEDIFKLKFETKKENRFGGTLLGMMVGSLPGVIYLQFVKSKDRDLAGALLEAPVEYGFGVGLIIGGMIVGGIIGHNKGKGASVEIPIFGKKDLYQKQKEKIRQLGLD